MKIIIFITIWVIMCLLLGGEIIPNINDYVDYQEQYCGTGGLAC